MCPCLCWNCMPEMEWGGSERRKDQVEEEKGTLSHVSLHACTCGCPWRPGASDWCLSTGVCTIWPVVCPCRVAGASLRPHCREQVQRGVPGHWCYRRRDPQVPVRQRQGHQHRRLWLESAVHLARHPGVRTEAARQRCRSNQVRCHHEIPPVRYTFTGRSLQSGTLSQRDPSNQVHSHFEIPPIRYTLTARSLQSETISLQNRSCKVLSYFMIAAISNAVSSRPSGAGCDVEISLV